MMISGVDIVDDYTMELKLIPITTVKKKKLGLMELASGNLDTLVSELQKDKQYKTTLYIPVKQWNEMNLKLGKHVTVEMLPDDTTGGME